MTDERQMRFEEWADSEGVAQDLGDPERCGDGYIARDWDFLWQLWLARDAEVQALRELLYEIKFKAGMSHINQTMEQQQRLLYDISDAARAALAGEKGSSDAD